MALSYSAGAVVPLFMSEIEQLGGAERAILALARFLHSRGQRPELVTYIDHCDFAKYADFPLRIRELKPAGGLRGKIAALRAYVRSLPKRGPLVLASGYQPALHLTLAQVDGFHCLMHDTPALFMESPLTWNQKSRIAMSNQIIGYGMQRGSGRMIVTSEFLRDDCRRVFNVEADIARMGGLGAPGGFQRRQAKDELRMLSVCRIEANKRIDWLLDALATMEPGLSARFDWRLELAGKGSQLQALQARAASLRLGGRVIFHGFVPDAELECMYAEAHLFLMPAVQGYGIPAIEALQGGLPVLLHRESGVSDILLETPWARVIRGGAEDVAGALEQLISFVSEEAVLTAEQPVLPTEQAWSERVARLCRYIA